jgi:hypothetical protein
VQYAYDWGLLTLDIAAQIVRLTAEDQLDIAVMIYGILETARGVPAKESMVVSVTTTLRRRRPDLVLLSDALRRLENQVRCIKVDRSLDEAEIARINQMIEQLSALRDAKKLKDPTRVAAE